jgi:hypothetical protein
MNQRNQSKSQLFMMEFLIVLLLFAVCSAICISAFVRADHISRDSVQLNRALTLAQSVAEEIKATGLVNGEVPTYFFNDDFYVRIDRVVEDQILIADITVSRKDDANNRICQIQVKKYLAGRGTL